MFVDFSRPHTERRGHLIDVDRQRDVIDPFLVAHGARIPSSASDEEKRRLAYGLVGLFLGPIILSVFYELLTAWVQDDQGEPEDSPPK